MDPIAIKTQFLIISDTHGLPFEADKNPEVSVDVAIHCGDLTEHSELTEFQTTIQMFDSINVPLKLVIAGNHDFSLDKPAFNRKIAEAKRVSLETLEDKTIQDAFGEEGAARKL